MYEAALSTKIIETAGKYRSSLKSSESTAHAAMVAGANLIIGGMNIINTALRSAPETEFAGVMEGLVVDIAVTLSQRIDEIKAVANELGIVMEKGGQNVS